MALKTPEHGKSSNLGSPKSHVTGSFVSISSLVSICTKQAGRITRKLRPSSRPSHTPRQVPKSPLAGPKQLLKNISNTESTMVHKTKNGENGGDGGTKVEEEDEWGNGGVWQRAILMGDKCQPLDFAGVIYYDCNGKQVNEMPFRSPRASPFPGYLSGGF